MQHFCRPALPSICQSYHIINMVAFLFIAALSGNLADQPLIRTITKRLCYIGHVSTREQMRSTLTYLLLPLSKPIVSSPSWPTMSLFLFATSSVLGDRFFFPLRCFCGVLTCLSCFDILRRPISTTHSPRHECETSRFETCLTSNIKQDKLLSLA